MRGSDFAELKAFAAIVERASFARAAEHLRLSPSALSQTIRQLESRLDSRLLNRTTRSVAPTAAGDRLYSRIAPLLREMADATAEASASAARVGGALRIQTTSLAAQQIIAPRLGRFHRAHPQVVLDIVVDDGLRDMESTRFDAGIRVGERLEKDTISVRLTPDMRMIAVASPEYLAHQSVPQVPADLHQHSCISRRLSLEGRADLWAFEKKGQRIQLETQGPLITNDDELGVAAALQGLGIAYVVDREQIEAHRAQGRLVRVLADWSIARPGLFLYYVKRRHPSLALSAFIDCMLERDFPEPASRIASGKRAPR